MMAIDVFTETVVSFTEATKRLPRLRGGKKTSLATLYRWHMAGHRAADGTTARLETIKVGGVRCTSLEALQRFFDSLTGDDVQSVMPAPIESRQRQQEIEKAEAALRRHGI